MNSRGKIIPVNDNLSSLFTMIDIASKIFALPSAYISYGFFLKYKN